MVTIIDVHFVKNVDCKDIMDMDIVWERVEVDHEIFRIAYFFDYDRIRWTGIPTALIYPVIYENKQYDTTDFLGKRRYEYIDSVDKLHKRQPPYSVFITSTSIVNDKNNIPTELLQSAIFDRDFVYRLCNIYLRPQYRMKQDKLKYVRLC